MCPNRVKATKIMLNLLSAKVRHSYWQISLDHSPISGKFAMCRRQLTEFRRSVSMRSIKGDRAGEGEWPQRQSTIAATHRISKQHIQQQQQRPKASQAHSNAAFPASRMCLHHIGVCVRVSELSVGARTCDPLFTCPGPGVGGCKSMRLAAVWIA